MATPWRALHRGLPGHAGSSPGKVGQIHRINVQLGIRLANRDDATVPRHGVILLRSHAQRTPEGERSRPATAPGINVAAFSGLCNLGAMS